MKKILPLLLLLLLLQGCTVSDDTGLTAFSEKSAGTYTEREVTVNPGEWELPGTLTIPDGDGPFPAVVFVHGSGPADRDETLGKQKPFKDLASDLAEKGIASLRYDKRTYTYGTKMASDTSLTVKEETIDDALFAVQTLASEEKIDASRIYIIGHSMGGYLVPRIDAQDTEDSVAGYVLLAGSVRSVLELLPVQIDYLLLNDKTLSDEQKETTRQQYATLIDAIKALTEEDKGSDKALMGAYPTYWLDLADYKPAEMVKSITEPILVLQGGHDYQVTETDFNLWKDALKNNPKATFKLFPELTHTFVKTEKMSTPEDYNTYNEVDSEVSDAIYTFINGQSDTAQ
ncbi:MAG: alpha/beta hydrolase family protein [Eubacteriales bacterium]